MANLTLGTNPPTDNPNLPSFIDAEALDIAPELQLVLDCWTNLKGRKSLYLNQEEREPARAYKNRLDRTRFDNRFEPVIKGHAGLLSDFQLTDDAPPTLEEAEENIDLQGNDLQTFFQNLDEHVLRDGGVGILVEYPKEDPGIRSNGDMLESGRRPYLVLIDRRNILNWDVACVNGVPTIQRVTVREQRKVAKGLFGSETQIFYRVLTPGRFDLFQVLQGEDGWRAVHIEEESGDTDLDVVPMVWYGADSDSQLFVSKPPFINLAGLNIEHLQKRSNLNEVLWKCNMPVPVRKGFVQNSDSKKPIPPLVIGPNSVVDVPKDGDFAFAEPTGTAIDSTQTDIEKLEGAMDRESLAFLNGGEAEKTATEVVIDSAQTSCTLKGMARRKENTFKKVCVVWCAYTGEEEPADSAGIKVADNVLQAPPNPQDIQLILDAMGNKLSLKLGLEMLLQRKWLPADTDIEEELKNLEQAEQEKAEQVLAEQQGITEAAGSGTVTPMKGNKNARDPQATQDAQGITDSANQKSAAGV
jgi:hypothetical protein